MADILYTTLIDINDIRILGRKMSRLRDDEDVEVLILDAQAVNLKHQLGDRLYIDLLTWKTDPVGLPDFSLLMDGGVYNSGAGSCRCGPIAFEGVRRALVYYTQALMVQHPSFITRFSVVQKEDAYNSANIELKQRIAYENGLRTTADLFMRNTLRYIHSDTSTFDAYGNGCCGKKPGQTSNIKVKILGE